MLKIIMLFNIFVETMMHFFQDYLVNLKTEIEIFCNIFYVFTNLL